MQYNNHNQLVQQSGLSFTPSCIPKSIPTCRSTFFQHLHARNYLLNISRMLLGNMWDGLFISRFLKWSQKVMCMHMKLPFIIIGSTQFNWCRRRGIYVRITALQTANKPADNPPTEKLSAHMTTRPWTGIRTITRFINQNWFNRKPNSCCVFLFDRGAYDKNNAIRFSILGLSHVPYAKPCQPTNPHILI